MRVVRESLVSTSIHGLGSGGNLHDSSTTAPRAKARPRARIHSQCMVVDDQAERDCALTQAFEPSITATPYTPHHHPE